MINNTDWECPEAFMNWLFLAIHKNLKELQVPLENLNKELGVIFVEEEDMLALNTNFRDKNYITDVLSFSMDGGVLGEIVMCPAVIAKQAIEHELHKSEELAYLFLHGILHLLGFDHEEDPKSAKEMFNIQDKVFDILQSEDIVGAFTRSLSQDS